MSGPGAISRFCAFVAGGMDGVGFADVSDWVDYHLFPTELSARLSGR